MFSVKYLDFNYLNQSITLINQVKIFQILSILTLIMHIQIIFSFAIAILYVFFFNKLSQLITKDDTIQDNYKMKKYVQKSTGKKFSYIPYTAYETNGQTYNENDFEISEEYKENEKKLEKQNNKRFYILLITGVVGIVISAMLKNSVVSMGVSIGSIMLILYSTYLYWSNINEYMKLGLIAVSIGALIYTSYKFVPSFGIKAFTSSLTDATAKPVSN